MSKAGVKLKMTPEADYGYVKGGGETEDDTETLTMDMSKAGMKQKMT